MKKYIIALLMVMVMAVPAFGQGWLGEIGTGINMITDYDDEANFNVGGGYDFGIVEIALTDNWIYVDDRQDLNLINVETRLHPWTFGACQPYVGSLTGVNTLHNDTDTVYGVSVGSNIDIYQNWGINMNYKYQKVDNGADTFKDRF